MALTGNGTADTNAHAQTQQQVGKTYTKNGLILPPYLRPSSGQLWPRSF